MLERKPLNNAASRHGAAAGSAAKSWKKYVLLLRAANPVGPRPLSLSAQVIRAWVMYSSSPQ